MGFRCIISQKAAAGGISLLRRCIFRSPNSCFGNKGARMFSVAESLPSRTLPSRTSPWLMLPPTSDDGDVTYNFYSLAENRVLSFNKRNKDESEKESPDDDARIVGSSHGWLALLNRRNNDLFLSNPVSRRHIKLPPLHTLPGPEINRGSVSKLILTCSPDDEEDKIEVCGAIIAFGPGDRLASCCPGRSRTWTAMAHPFIPYNYALVDYAKVWEDFVCCSSTGRLNCIYHFEIELDHWDLGEPPLSRPRIRLWHWDLVHDSPSYLSLFFKGEKCRWWRENKEVLDECMQIPYFVYGGKELSLEFYEGKELFLVIRFVKGREKASTIRHWSDFYPYKTIGFSVLKVDVEGRRNMRFMEGSLDGLAMFVGMNQSFAISAAEFPELKPNSIYFTDAHKFTSKVYGGSDIGIFDYENKTFSPCYYPCDFEVESLGQRIVPPPMWFTPSPY